MGDIQKGVAFSGASPNNVVTGDKLNNLVDNAVIQTAFFTGKGEESAAAAGDFLLMWDASANLFKKISVQNLIPTGVSRTGFRNLKAANVPGHETTQIAVTADEVVMRSDLGVPYYALGFSATVDCTVYSGASTLNGRDFTPLPAATAGAWYYLYAISNGSVNGLLFSNSASSPALPAGYLYYAILGAWRTGAGVTTLMTQVQRGLLVAVPWGSDATVPNGNNPWIGATEFTTTQINPTINVGSDIDLSRCVPPIASSVSGLVGKTNNADCIMRLASESVNETGLQVLFCTAGSTAARGFRAARPFTLPLTTPQQIYCASLAGNESTYSMRISGYTLNL